MMTKGSDFEKFLGGETDPVNSVLSSGASCLEACWDFLPCLL